MKKYNIPNFKHKKDFIEYYKKHAKKGDKFSWDDYGEVYIDDVYKVSNFGIEIDQPYASKIINWNNILDIYTPNTHPEHYL
jgi:hypothetical protein